MKALVVVANVGLLGLGTATASAEEITPTRGTGLGQHVSSMAPEHAISMSLAPLAGA